MPDLFFRKFCHWTSLLHHDAKRAWCVSFDGKFARDEFVGEQGLVDIASDQYAFGVRMVPLKARRVVVGQHERCSAESQSTSPNT